MNKTLSVLFFLFVASLSWAQEKCITHIVEEEMRRRYPEIGTKQDFENWMAQKIAERRSNPNQRTGPYRVPVIIHIIHDGSAVGNNSVNIPYGQAMSQLRVLNEDFQKTNADFSTNVLSTFQARAGSLDITFEAVTKDPNGNDLPEPGVERINGATAPWGGGRTSWSQADCDNILKPNTIWDPTKYCNIWVVRFSGSGDTGLFGYAQFPQGSGLPGVPGGGTALTDGCVINWRAFGSNYNADGTPLAVPYVSPANLICSNCDKGRTLTHEIGHWLGLRHIWGDSEAGCSNPNNNDYCQDTPFTTSANNITSGCPARPDKCPNLEPSYGNVNTPDQRENYMDYSSDGCMGMFTIDQITRVETVLLNSPRRNELLTSPALPVIITNGAIAGIGTNRTTILEGEQVTFSGSGVIGTNETPNTVQSWSWNFDVDGLGGASPSTSTVKNPGNVTFAKVGVYKVSLTISNGNGATDTKTINITSNIKAPTGLNFTNAVAGRVTSRAVLQWTDNSANEAEYLVERRLTTPSNSPFTLLATLPPNTTTYTDEFEGQILTNTIKQHTYRVTAKKGTSVGSVERAVVLDDPLSINEELSREIRLYPNPANGQFTVDLKNIQVRSASVELYNVLGQQVIPATDVKNNEISISTKQTPKGVYVLKIHTDKGVAVKRLIIN
jgi:zinc-dependent metalloproteinase lipoprotein